MPRRLSRYNGGHGFRIPRTTSLFRLQEPHLLSVTLYAEDPSVYIGTSTMEFPHRGESIYYRHQATFVRDLQGHLLYCVGPRADTVREHWYSLRQLQRDDAFCGLKLYELQETLKGIVSGIFVASAKTTAVSEEFEKFFCKLILTRVDFAISPLRESLACSENCQRVTDKIVSLFDTHLRYQGEDDKWEVTGKAYFTKRVQHFTAQGKRVELCLPAFPCKSSNTDKVTGKDPDSGEQLALERLHGFIEAIEKIYAAGAKLWIISDGHVFSDCSKFPTIIPTYSKVVTLCSWCLRSCCRRLWPEAD